MLLIIAASFVYLLTGALVGSVLRRNYMVLRRARLVDDLDNGSASTVFGSILWPILGISLLVHHRNTYGLTRSDRSVMRSENIDHIRGEMQEYRERRLRKLERELGVRR